MVPARMAARHGPSSVAYWAPSRRSAKSPLAATVDMPSTALIDTLAPSQTAIVLSADLVT